MILGEISPYFFENKLIISLSKEWIEYFGKIPDFEVILEKNGRLLLRSKTVSKKGEIV